jgi:hypothetical protein
MYTNTIINYIEQWLNTGHTTCPVCKAGVSRENVIPLYIRGSSEDPRYYSITYDILVVCLF